MISLAVIVISLSFIYGWGTWGALAFIPIIAYSSFTTVRQLVATALPFGFGGWYFLLMFVSLHWQRLVGLGVIVAAYFVSWGNWIWLIGIVLIVRQRGDYGHILYGRIRSQGITDYEEESNIVRSLAKDKKLLQVTQLGYLPFVLTYIAVALNLPELIQTVLVVSSLAVNLYVGFKIERYIDLFVLNATGSVDLEDKSAKSDRPHADASLTKEQLSEVLEKLEENENGVKFHRELGMVHYNNGKFSDAVKLFDKAIGLNPNYSELYVCRGAAYFGLSQYENSVADLSKAIEISPDYAHAYYNRCVAYGKLGQTEHAMSDLIKAAEFDSKYANECDEFGAKYCKIMKIDEPDIAKLFWSAFKYSELKKYELAVADLSKAIGLSTNYAEVYFNRGVAYSYLSQHEHVIADFTKVIELDPNNTDAYFNRGFAYYKVIDNSNTYRETERECAIADFTKAIELEPNHAKAYYGRGLVYSHRKIIEAERAMADFNRAIEINPNYTNAYNGRGDLYKSLGETKSAVADYTKAIELDPNYAVAYFNLGVLYRYSKNYERSISNFSKAIEIDTNDSISYSWRGNTYIELKQYELAKEDFKTMLRLAREQGDGELARDAEDSLRRLDNPA